MNDDFFLFFSIRFFDSRFLYSKLNPLSLNEIIKTLLPLLQKRLAKRKERPVYFRRRRLIIDEENLKASRHFFFFFFFFFFLFLRFFSSFFLFFFFQKELQKKSETNPKLSQTLNTKIVETFSSSSSFKSSFDFETRKNHHYNVRAANERERFVFGRKSRIDRESSIRNRFIQTVFVVGFFRAF